MKINNVLNLPRRTFYTNNKSCFAMHIINNMAKTLVKIGQRKNGQMLKFKTKCNIKAILEFVNMHVVLQIIHEASMLAKICT